MYTVSETIEIGNIYVTCHPGIWIQENILLWPPAGSVIDRKNIVTPEPDWIPHKCRILRENIETFEEALELEKMYSKHRDSNSFREDNERKKLKRDHPVNANLSDLIDLNQAINKINAGERSKAKSTLSVGNNTPIKQENKYHKQCLQKPKPRIPKKVVVSGPNKNRRIESKTSLKSKPSQAEKTSRYPNYLKSGKKPTIPSSTITKKEYLKLDGLSSEPTDEKEVTVRGLVGMSDKQELLENTGSYAGKGTQFPSIPYEVQSSVQNSPFSRGSEHEVERNLYETDAQGSSTPLESQSNVQNVLFSRGSEYDVERNIAKIDKATFKSKPIIQENILIRQGTSSSTHRSASFEESVLKSLNELKNAQKKSEEQHLLLEARMIIKHDNFVNEILQTQGRRQNRGQRQDLVHVLPEVHPVDPVPLVEEDFDDLDEKFPLTLGRAVEELEWNIRTDLEFKFRLKSRVKDFIAKSPRKTIRLIMKYLFRDTVLELYCWNGTSKKVAFKQFKSINNFIYNIVSENFKTYKKTRFQSYMGEWLKHARSRQRIVKYSYPKRKIETDDDDDANDDDGNDDDANDDDGNDYDGNDDGENNDGDEQDW